MQAFQDLMNLLAEWRQFSEAEGAAIRSADWHQVSQCQAAKHLLQARIVEAHQVLDSRWELTGGGKAAQDPRVRGAISDLIAMEQRNGEWLEQQWKKAEAERAELSRTSRNLRQVQKAYVPRGDAAWNSYS